MSSNSSVHSHALRSPLKDLFMPHRPTVFITEFSVADRQAGPYGVTAGPDGALWFTMVQHGRIGRLTSDGNSTSYQLEPVTSRPSLIAAGPDGALWFTESRSHRIGRIATAGDVSSFPLPTPSAGPFSITAGPDNALWFTEAAADRIGRVTIDGRITEFPFLSQGPSRPRSPQARTIGCGSR